MTQATAEYILSRLISRLIHSAVNYPLCSTRLFHPILTARLAQERRSSLCLQHLAVNPNPQETEWESISDHHSQLLPSIRMISLSAAPTTEVPGLTVSQRKSWRGYSVIFQLYIVSLQSCVRVICVIHNCAHLERHWTVSSFEMMHKSQFTSLSITYYCSVSNRLCE